jgi:hypothetical protein
MTWRRHPAIRSIGWTLRHTSKLVHRLLLLGTGILVAASCLLAAASWRLSQGPIDLTWLSDRLQGGVFDQATQGHVSFDRLALAWEGFAKGVDHAIDLRVTNLDIADPSGRKVIAAPDAHLTLSPAGLLLGRFVPRSLEVDHASVTVFREPTGAIDLGSATDGTDQPDPDFPPLAQLWDRLAHPASSDRGAAHGLFDQLQRVHFRDATLTFRDQASGLSIRAGATDLDLIRASNGRIHGTLQGLLSSSGEQAALTAEVNLLFGANGTLTFGLTPFTPSALKPLPPAWAFLTDLDVPVAISGSAVVDAAFHPGNLRTTLHLGQGRIRIGKSAIPVRSGTIGLSGTTESIAIQPGHLQFALSADGTPETADLSGTITRGTDRVRASLAVGVEHIDIADIPLLWPAGVGDDARAWVTEHLTGGIARKGAASVVIEADQGLHGVVLTEATGELDATNASFTWMDNMPPVEQADVHLRLVDPDTLDIHLATARQRVARHQEGLSVKEGDMRITGLSQPDQSTAIHVKVEGQVITALALLNEPRLHLLSAHPIGLSPTAGDVSAALDFRFPLLNNLRIDDVQIHAAARLANVRIPDVAAGQELDDGAFDLGIDKDGLDLKGKATFAAIPVALDGRMEFNAEAADQVVQRITATGQPDATQIDAAGLHVSDAVSGPVPMTLVLLERRNGAGSIAVNADLTQAALAMAPLAWHKPPGSSVTADATVSLSHDRLTRIDHFFVHGDDVTLSGSADLGNRQSRSVQLDTVQLGRTQGHGTIHVNADNAIDVALQGSRIDLSAKLTEPTRKSAPAATPVWRLDARFDRAILANGETASDIVAIAAGAGDTVGALDITGGGFSIKLRPNSGRSALTVEAKDAGRFLRGIDVARNLQSGRLHIDGVVDGPSGFHPMSGTIVIDNVVARNSPLLATLLQAVTIYGVLDVLRGPGLTFTRVVIPFHYDGADITLDDAHASNSSLGLTAKGRIGLASGQISLAGTIVPAYFFNAILGKLPLVGKLFSPEKGGGVFAASYSLDGPLDDPRISINPVSALTPGFLREIFNVFDKMPADRTAPRPH